MLPITNLAEAEKALAAYIPQLSQGRGAYTLERMHKLMEFLGNPQNTYQVIHIAGTSGKTSTASYVAAFIGVSVKTAGLTVSPYVDNINERVQVLGQALSEEVFCKYLSNFLDLVTESGINPTYIEVLIAFAYWVFAKEKVDYAVIEVGMGGLLDPTNVVKNSEKICIVTDIGFDHTHVLGDTLTKITAQKAGIILPHNTVFMYEQGDDVMRIVREVCDQVHAELHEVRPISASQLPPKLPLFQKRNWYMAYSVYQYLVVRDGLPELDESQLAQTTKTYIPGRMEIFKTADKTVVFDGAHNEQKLGALIKALKQQFPGAKFAVLMGMAKRPGTHVKGSIEVVAEIAEQIIFTGHTAPSSSPKQPINPTKLAEHAHKLGYDKWEVAEDIHDAYRKLLARPDPVLLVTGSFYLVSEVKRIAKVTSKVL